VLLFDNLRVAHAGLPGLGPRELAVQMYNSIILRPDGSGLLQIDSP
jgi:hypothetical protein